MAIPVKTKSSWPVSLSEAKRHLRVDEDFHDDDDYISVLIQAATEKAERYIGKDIAETTSVQALYDFLGSYLWIPEGNFRSLDYAVTDTSVYATISKTDIRYNGVYIEFDTSYDADPLTISYSTGYTEGECPPSIKQAVLIKIADLFDIDRQSYTEGSIKESKAFEYLLDSFRLVEF